MEHKEVICINANGSVELVLGNTYVINTVTNTKDFVTLKNTRGAHSIERFVEKTNEKLVRGDIVISLRSDSNIEKGQIYKVEKVVDNSVTLMATFGVYNMNKFVKIAPTLKKDTLQKVRIAKETIFEIAGDLKCTDLDGVTIEIQNGVVMSYQMFKEPPKNARFDIGDIVVIESGEEVAITGKTNAEITGVIINGFNKGDKRTYTASGSNFVNKI